MSNKKILFYISTIRGGGAARVMVNIANEISKRGYNVCFVTNFPAVREYLLSPDIKRKNIEDVESDHGLIVKNIKRIYRLRKIIQDENPDISIAFMGENNFRLILAALGLRTKIIISVRNDPKREYRRPGTRQLASLLFRNADGIVFQTSEAKLWFPKKIQEKSRIIHNYVDEKFFNLNENLGNNIIACGRLCRQKNYPMMLQAFANVLKEFPNEKLEIYGEGELKEELVELSKELDISESIRFMGFVKNMDQIYRNAKLLLMTSNYEGMPNVLLEAQASSVPVITTDCPCGGPKMIINDGVNGYLSPVGDQVTFSEMIIEFLKNRDLQNDMRRNSYKMSETFSSETVLKEWTKLFDDISN